MADLFSLAKRPYKEAMRIYYKIRYSFPVWRRINRRGISLFQQNPPHLTGRATELVAELKTNGIAVAHVDDIFPGENILEKMRAYAASIENTASVRTNKEFLKFYLDDKPMLNLENPLVSLAVNQKTLDIVNSYMSMFSKFYYFTLNKTMPVGNGAEAVQSQQWHRDPEDTKLVKIFVYLNDVDERAGPFTYVQGSHKEGPLGNLFPPVPPRGSLPPADEIRKTVPQEKIRTCTGKAGTIIFCDTRGIHRGGYATLHERLMLTLCYASYASLWPFRCIYPENFKEIARTKNFSPAQQYALDNFYRVGRKRVRSIY